MFIGAVFITAKRGSKTNVHQLVNGYAKYSTTIQLNVIWAYKRNEEHATTWMKLETL